MSPVQGIHVIYREEVDRWVKGDRYLRPVIRRLLRGERTQFSGMQRVVRNFLIGLTKRNVKYFFNRPFFTISGSKKVISFGLGINGLAGLNRASPVIAAIGFPYPAELPELCSEYNIKKFLVHSNWILEFVKSAGIYNDQIFDLWPAGIDTDVWRPAACAKAKEIDVLLYNKAYWDTANTNRELVQPIRNFLHRNNYSFSEITYGKYSIEDYKSQLRRAKAMIFLSAHESQGLAYQECLSSNVPVIAWDQGYWLDPVRYKYKRPTVRATSVPYFDERCGVKFTDINDFVTKFQPFFENCLMNNFKPRDFVLENLSIEKSTDQMLKIYESI